MAVRPKTSPEITHLAIQCTILLAEGTETKRSFVRTHLAQRQGRGIHEGGVVLRMAAGSVPVGSAAVSAA